MRIVGGRLRGRTVGAPASAAVRPTADRLREAIFNVLAHGWGDPVPGARALDLFAGTGAMAFEALSRGAAFATLVDDAPAAIALARANAAALGLADVVRLVRRDATRPGPLGPDGPADLAFCDPPYGRGLAERALLAAAAGGWLRPGALVVVEEAAGAFATPPGYAEGERRRYGGTEVAFLRAPGGPAEPGDPAAPGSVTVP